MPENGRRRLALLLLSTVLSAFSTFNPLRAAEIDSVTPRGVELDDAGAAINAIFNRRLEEAVTNANVAEDAIDGVDADDFCDTERLDAALEKAIFRPAFPLWGLQGYDLDLQLRKRLGAYSYTLSLRDSIYRDIDYLEGFSLRLKELSDLVRIEGHLVGLDKLGHFFAEGREYFERTRDEGKSLEQAMQWGKEQENGKFGYATTGIHSFADLTANFNGWRFWNDVLQTGHDPLRGRVDNFFTAPYVTCELQVLASLKHRRIVKAWVLNRRFDITDYIDGAWDETNNCNSYADPIIEEKVAGRIREIDPGFRCPLAPAECRRAQRKYGRYAKYLLHPRCLTVAPD